MERLCNTNIEQELRFRSWLKSNDIRFILLDMDDNVCDTRRIFIDKMNESVRIIIQDTLDFSEVKRDLRAINDRLFETNSVNPNRMGLLIEDMQSRWGFSDDIKKMATDKLMEIYETPIPYLEGSEDAISFLNKTQTEFGIVTHANKPWTWRKFNWLSLGRFMDWDDIYIVDENAHKTAETWLAAADYFKIKPQVSMVVGDSPRSDMCAGYVGFKHLYLTGSKQNRWSIHDVAMPEGVVEIGSLANIAHLGCCIQ